MKLPDTRSVFASRDAFLSVSISLILTASVPLIQQLQSEISLETPIHVGMIVKNAAKMTDSGIQYQMQFHTLLNSILKHSRKSPIHLVLLVDEASMYCLLPIIKSLVRTKAKVPVSYDFLNIEAIGSDFIDVIDQIKEFFTSNSEQAKKYSDILFMLAPFYHWIFPYDRLIMLDIDLKFKVSLEELYSHFDLFSEDNLIGVGSDLAPHYHHVLRFYLDKNPESHLGKPGKFQGFNTGVVLFNLKKMRQSKFYNEIAANVNNSVIHLVNKYSFRSHLGDQCLFTLIGFEYPDWFYHLPCEYNYQLDTMMKFQFPDIFSSFHHCPNDPKIYHGNGGASIPLDEHEEKLVRINEETT